MNTEIFTGKAESYAKARPGYPDAAIEYIIGLVPPNAVFADVGAGTGIFTKLLAEKGFPIFAVEPNDDMREQLAATLSSFSNAQIIAGSAEATTLPDSSVDVITCAQALHWFNPNAFWDECRRIGKPDGVVIAVYNNIPDGSGIAHRKFATDEFFNNPIIQEFPNSVYYTREKWLIYMTSHSHDPLPSDPNYAAHMNEMNAVFDRENIDGFLCRRVITKVYSEKIKL